MCNRCSRMIRSRNGCADKPDVLMGTIFILLLTILAVADGCLLTFLVIAQAALFARLCYGAVVGLLALAWLGFLVSLVTGLNATAIVIVTAILAVSAVALYKTVSLNRLKAELRAFQPDRWGIVYYLAWAAFLGLLFSRVISLSDDGLYTSPVNNYGDLPFHFSVITSFATGENLPPRNPIFNGLPFTYPFLIDFLTAFFRRAGADWFSAFFVENIILALSLVGVIELMTMKLIGNRLAARIAPLLFLFNGGFGFVYFFRDLSAAPGGLWSFLAQMKTYTMNDELHLRWGNVFTTLLIPQRSLLFGLPLAGMIITLWWQGVSDAARGRRGEGAMRLPHQAFCRLVFSPLHLLRFLSPCRRVAPSPRRPLASSPRRLSFLAAGVLAGLMPMAHAHGFFSVMIVSAILALVFFSWDWLAFFIPAGLLALPQALWLSGTPTRSKMFEPHFGWEAHDLWQSGQMSPLTFWLINAGAFLLLLLIALINRDFVTARARRFYLPFLLCFILPNVVLLAPWAWDNIKVLLYWYLASCALVAAVLAGLASSKLILARLLSLVFFLFITLSGALDVARSLSSIEHVQLFNKTELDLAEVIRQQTRPHSVILNAPIHNSVIVLTGRQMLMGYPGHLWTHGIDYQQREADVMTIFRGGPEAEILLKSYGVDYLLVGPVERSQFGVNETFFAGKYRAVIDQSGYRLYQIKQP